MIDFSLQGKKALVTGASGGLGLHFANVLSENGATVVLAARREDKIMSAANNINSNGGTAFAVELDVTDENSIDQAFTYVENKVGIIDVIVNNAGIATNGAAVDVTLGDWNRVMAANLDGAFLVSRRAARTLIIENRSGSIINIGSILGTRTAGGVLPYTVSKAGLHHMTKVLALEWARYNIRVNAITPGYIETDINRDYLNSHEGQKLIKRIPHRRPGEMDDLDGPLLLLASDQSLYMTGSIIAVDGGHLVSTL